MNESVWIFPCIQDEVTRLSLELGIPLQIANILVNRNICDVESAHKFLYGTIDDLHDPFLMSGMEQAVNRIKKAVVQKEKILLFGDYDVDGILSIVVLLKTLKFLGLDPDYYIPDRLKEGYGIKEEHIKIVLQRKATLLISVDSGIKAVKFVDRAKENGIDVIITDHHQPGDSLPDALAILNPVLKSSGYPDKKLAGIGVVFKLIQALMMGEKESRELSRYLKFVSIGTITDVVSLRGENRVFVKFGLKELESISNKGLSSLMEMCSLKRENITVGDIGFRVGPRINAAGRIGRADLAVELFFAETGQRARELATELDRLNSKRQKIEEKIYNQAVIKIKERSIDKHYRLLLIGSEEWHRGVIGIVASKLKDNFHRPVILFVYKDGKAYGSGRSIREFSLIECLNENRKFFINYGGHPMAVGCEVSCENMKSMKEALNAYAKVRLKDEDLKKKIYIDAKIDFNSIDVSFFENLSLLSPFGVGNPNPLFLAEKVEVAVEPKKINRKHSKFFVRQDGRIFEALGWKKGEWADTICKGDVIDLVFSFQISNYLGERKYYLSIEDLRKSS